MPLKEGKSKKTISANIEELIASWKDKGRMGSSKPKSLEKAEKQAAAIAYSKTRRKR